MTPWISYVTKVNRANKLMALAWTKVRHSLLVPGIESACLFTCTESVGLGAGRVPPWGEGCWAGTAESQGHFPYRLCRSEASGSVRIHFLAYTFLFFFFHFLFLSFLFSPYLHWLKPPIQHWIKVMQAEITALFRILGRKRSVYSAFIPLHMM